MRGGGPLWSAPRLFCVVRLLFWEKCRIILNKFERVDDMTMQKKNILNNFKDVLGQYCAINQFIELSKRCFVLDHEKDMATRENFIALATRNSGNSNRL